MKILNKTNKQMISLMKDFCKRNIIILKDYEFDRYELILIDKTIISFKIYNKYNQNESQNLVKGHKGERYMSFQFLKGNLKKAQEITNSFLRDSYLLDNKNFGIQV